MTIAFNRRHAVANGAALATQVSAGSISSRGAVVAKPLLIASEIQVQEGLVPPFKTRVGLLRRMSKLAYLLVRPIVRPLAWRVRTFLHGDMSAQIQHMRAAEAGTSASLDSLLAQGHTISELLAGFASVTPGYRTRTQLRRKVHQFHAGSAIGDAITNAMLLLQQELRTMGYESEIFVEHVGNGLAQRLHPLHALPMNNDHVLLVHHSMGHGGFAQVLRSAAPKVLIYHNITPPNLLAHNPFMQRAAELGRTQLAKWRDHVVAALPDSVFNGLELRRLGFPCVREAMLLFDLDTLLARAKAAPLRAAGSAFTVLFVGREVPSKGQADLVDAFAHFARRYQRSTGRTA